MKEPSEKPSLFVWATEIFYWFKTFLSPFIGGIAVGLVFYVIIGTEIGEYIFWVFAIIGFVGGILFATYVWRKYGTANYQARISATPDIDKFNKESQNKQP